MSRYFVLVCVVLLSLGCATNRGVVDLTVAPNAAGSSTGAAEIAADAPLVHIVNIEDNRTFELKPKDPSIPSLKDGDINNVSTTSRAIARKRNGWGQAMGDILLPEGRAVTDVVRENVAQAFRDSGYQVVESPTEGAIPMTVSIGKFWAWVTPGFWAIKVDFQSELSLHGDLEGVSSPLNIVGTAREGHSAVTSGAWIQTMQLGMANLRKNIVDQLASK